MRDFPEDTTEFQLAWTSQGEKVSVLGEVVATVNSKAAEAFTRRRDDIAHAMRDLAIHFERQHKEASELLSAFIAEDQRREMEFRRVMKGPRPKNEIKREVRP